MLIKYRGLCIRAATEEEKEHFIRFWGEDFTGLVAEMPACTSVILREAKSYTPFGAFRISDAGHAMIHAGYSQYDRIYLRDGQPEMAVLDVADWL